MLTKNVFGDMEYVMDEFFIPHRTGSDNKYHILKHGYFIVTDPIWGLFQGFWDKPPAFDSFVQAVKWLKEHKEELV